jgi:hypothetical protein
MSDLSFYSSISITGSLPEMLKQVEIFTDGSCLGNQGPAAMARFSAFVAAKNHSAKVIV